MQRVMEAVGANNVVLKQYAHGRIAQQFFFDKVTKTVKSKQWSNRSMNIHGNNLNLSPTNSRWFQIFRYNNGYISVEKVNKVMDVSSNRDVENQNIHMWKKHNGLNQQWDIVYVKDIPAEPKKGEWNRDFGFKVDTDFHIVTRMRSGRYIDILGRNMVLKTPNNRRTQIWYFHQPSKTVRSRNNNQSFDI
jgi:hypothetical protein